MLLNLIVPGIIVLYPSSTPRGDPSGLVLSKIIAWADEILIVVLFFVSFMPLTEIILAKFVLSSMTPLLS